jgi:DNA-binding GntR family transcriptional regulator
LDITYLVKVASLAVESVNGKRGVSESPPAEESGCLVDRVYEQVTALAVSFELRPGERINEGAIARRLGVSRTPLREALNRLTGDGFLTFSPKRGFIGRRLDVKDMFDLAEVRLQIEASGVRLVVMRASDASLEEVSRYLDECADSLSDRTVEELVKLDEGFHERVMALTGNKEMLRILKNIHARIRFVRWVDMEGLRNVAEGEQRAILSEHRAILEAIKARDAVRGATLVNDHINRRLSQVVDTLKEAYARLYVHPSASTMTDSGV